MVGAGVIAERVLSSSTGIPEAALEIGKYVVGAAVFAVLSAMRRNSSQSAMPGEEKAALAQENKSESESPRVETDTSHLVRDMHDGKKFEVELLATAPWLGMVDNVVTVEFNTFGDQPRTAVLYRDADGTIVDWRWFTSKDQIPRAIGDGRYVAIWDDQGRPRMVYCTSVYASRTRLDKELEERKRWPEEKRRKLSRK